jgi:hypothetical protein
MFSPFGSSVCKIMPFGGALWNSVCARMTPSTVRSQLVATPSENRLIMSRKSANVIRLIVPAPLFLAVQEAKGRRRYCSRLIKTPDPISEGPLRGGLFVCAPRAMVAAAIAKLIRRLLAASGAPVPSPARSRAVASLA